jgi:hypothetical protein
MCDFSLIKKNVYEERNPEKFIKLITINSWVWNFSYLGGFDFFKCNI